MAAWPFDGFGPIMSACTVEVVGRAIGLNRSLFKRLALISAQFPFSNRGNGVIRKCFDEGIEFRRFSRPRQKGQERKRAMRAARSEFAEGRRAEN